MHDTIRRPSQLVLALAVLLAVPALAGGSRELSGSTAVQRGREVRIEIPVAKLDVEGYDGDRVEAELRARCDRSRSRCEEMLEDLELEIRGGERGAEVTLRGYPKWNTDGLEIEGVIRVPRSSPIDLELGVGELQVEGTAEDLSIDLGVGEATVRVSAAEVSSVSVDVGVGEARIRSAEERVDGERSFLIGSEAEWSRGRGSARVKVDVGVGEARVEVE